MFSIVPHPVEVTALGGRGAPITSATRLVTGATGAELEAGIVLAGVLGGLIGQAIAVVEVEPGETPQEGDIVLRLDDAAGPAGSTSDERYTLVCRDGVVDIAAATQLGIMRGMATLGQLLEPEPAGGFVARPARVVDAPRYPWRGLSLDVARHFFEVDDVKQVIALMTRYKFNVLHLHLTDDQGWRIQVPSRPDLTDLSSSTGVGGGPGGYYTVDDFVYLQRYARARGITVIPEIDLPGHTNAALHAYPELNPTASPPRCTPASRWASPPSTPSCPPPRGSCATCLATWLP